MAAAGIVCDRRAGVLAGSASDPRRELHRLLQTACWVGAIPRVAVRHPAFLHHRAEPEGSETIRSWPTRCWPCSRGISKRTASSRWAKSASTTRPTRGRVSSRQIEIARAAGQPVLIHTPHRDKKRGTERTIAVVRALKFPEERVLIDHNTRRRCRSCWQPAAGRGTPSIPTPRWTSCGWRR